MSLTQLLRHQSSAPIQTPAASLGTLARPCSAGTTPARVLLLEAEVRRSSARRNPVILVNLLGRISWIFAHIGLSCFESAGAYWLTRMRFDAVIRRLLHWIIHFIYRTMIFIC